MAWKARLLNAANGLLKAVDLQISRRSEFIEPWRPYVPLRHSPGGMATTPSGPAFLKSYRGRLAQSPQKPVDFAVVMSTVLRPKIIDAIQSVFDQCFAGDVQLLIGIDREQPKDAYSPDDLDKLCRTVPDRHSVLVFYPGYSTSNCNGGLA